VCEWTIVECFADAARVSGGDVAARVVLDACDCVGCASVDVVLRGCNFADPCLGAAIYTGGLYKCAGVD
jgi:hypothetical protein